MIRLFSFLDSLNIFYSTFFFLINSIVLRFIGFSSKILNYFNFLLLSTFNLMKKLFNNFFQYDNFFFIFISIVIIILIFFNFLRVYPFVFPMSSRISFVALVSFTTWVSFVLWSYTHKITKFLYHLIPSGTPIILVLFLFIVELVRLLIRPITLTIRIVANIVAGHILLSLTSVLVTRLKIFITVYLALNIVEFFVAIIQAYIFCYLLILYFNERI